MSLPAPLLADHAVREIRNTLSGQIFWCFLPEAVRSHFDQRRQREFDVLVRLGWPLLLTLVAGVAVLGWNNFGNGDMGSRDGLLWWRVMLLQFLGLAAFMAVIRHPRLLPHYQRLIIVIGMLNLGVVVFGSIVIDSIRLAQSLTYVSMLVITIQVLALRLSLWTSGTSGFLGIAFGVSLAWAAWDRQPDWPMLLWSTLGSLVVTLFVGAIQERQERISYLQGLLLEHESQERERLNTVLEQMAHQDALSGLANRRYFDVLLEREWERMRREQQPMAALFIDVDHFKLYNDTYGHSAGDVCLASVGKTLAEAAWRPGDVAARYGGEEFVVLLPGADANGAAEVAERILAGVDMLAIPHASSPVAGHVTVSIGLAVLTPDGDNTAHALLDRADQALYAAKHAGRHRIVLRQTDVPVRVAG